MLDDDEDQVISEYSNRIKALNKECGDAGMSSEEFRKVYLESLNSLGNNRGTEQSRRSFISTKYKIALVGIVVLCAAYNFEGIYSSLVCNLQEGIYPGLRFLRRISIPIISLFPSLTDFYHETCLVQNPFFTVADMDCWPCSTISNIRQVTDLKSVNQQSAPFLYETDQKVVNLDTLKELFIKNQNIFNKEHQTFLVNNKYNVDPITFFYEPQTVQDKSYYVWRFNNMNEARILRQIIPRPKVVPKFGQSVQRFIIIDSSQQSYHIPETECSFSFLLSLCGSRTIDLVPAEECKHQCKTLKVELKESYLLWYNWWYWRPVVQPSSGNNTFIGHVGSYC